MRKNLLISLLITFHVVGFSQSYPGYNSGNFTGVNGAFFNPANIADSRYRWDVNLFSMNAMVGTTGTTFSLKNINNQFKGSIDSVLFGNTGKTVSAMANFDIFGPSFMFNIGKKTSFALTTRVRALANIQDVDGKLIQSLNDNLDFVDSLKLGSKNNQKIKANVWADFGATIGRVLYDRNKHFLKAGVTLKYLAGVANTHISIGSFDGTAKKDIYDETYITRATGSVSIGVSGVDVDNFKAKDALKFKSTGIGGDIGLVYEYRPKLGSHRYKFKAGLSLLDIGSIKYTPEPSKTGSYNIKILPSQSWYPKELKDSSLTGIKNYLDGSPYFTSTGSSTASYKVPLPTTVLINLDYNIHKGFYVGLSGQLNVAQKNNEYGSFYYNSVTLTPRYEGRSFGIYVPVNYNELTNFNAGVSLRLGPVFIGSGSILTAAFDKSKQADFHFGIRTGVVKKHRREVVVTKTKVVKETKIIEKPVVVPVVERKDTDGDGVFDEDDSCKTVVGLAKYHGCPIPDSDGDGVNDEEDSCKTVPGLAKYHGCPIPDTDGDGINDELDKCPQVPGLARYHGCPIPDSDGDGVNDEEDSCKTVPGSPKYHGCPVPDTDGDGLNDDVDKCPTVAGSKANFGCPEIKKEVIRKVNVAAKGLQFQTGKAVILKKSYAQLDNVVKILKADPTLKISIEGHTDNVGKEDKNMALSVARADAAKAYFIKKGIEEQRITSQGFGSTKPLVPNTTPANKLKNRRVVFTISNN